MMLEKRKCVVTEEDVSILLQRYTASTVLGVLQEVSQVGDVKIDWDALVRNTATGITNPREYQLLWRHLAYRHPLLQLHDSAQPMDDDSDIECELEAFPAVSSEASAEAAACVKVLIASGVPSDSNMPNSATVEAPLTINIPDSQTPRIGAENSVHGTSMHGKNITVPVAVQKDLLSTVAVAEGLDTNGPASTNLPPRRKRKPWSAAEDMELIAAVQKCGEGNWANILKGDFKGDRTASQLSQRWAIIRKRQGTMTGNGSQLSEAQLAARRAMSLALNMPMGDKLKAASPINAGVGPNSSGHNSSHSVAGAIASSGGARSQHQQDSSSLKPRVATTTPSPKLTTSQVSIMKAANVAVGSGVATPSNAVSMLKTTQSRTAIHVPGGGPSVKPSIAGSSNGLPSNVHFIRCGLVSRSTSQSKGSPVTQCHSSVKPTSSAIQPNPTAVQSKLHASTKPNASKSVPSSELEVNIKQQRQKNLSDEELAVDLGAHDDTPEPAELQDQIDVSDPLIEKVEGQVSFLGAARKESASKCQVEDKLINLGSQEIANKDTSDSSKAPSKTTDEGE